MATKLFSALVLLIGTACASHSPMSTSTPSSEREPSSEIASPSDNTDFSAARHQSTAGCNRELAAQRIVHIGAKTHSGHQCVAAVHKAYAGCSSAGAIHSGPNGVAMMTKAGWHCSHSSDPYSAPNGAVIAETNHVEIRVGNCFYSDFHDKECKPATRYHHRPRKMYGWCTP